MHIHKTGTATVATEKTNTLATHTGPETIVSTVENSLCEDHCSEEEKFLSTVKNKTSHDPLAKILTETRAKAFPCVHQDS